MFFRSGIIGVPVSFSAQKVKGQFTVRVAQCSGEYIRSRVYVRGIDGRILCLQWADIFVCCCLSSFVPAALCVIAVL